MLSFVLQVIAPNMPVEQYIHDKIDFINETILYYIYDRIYPKVRFKVFCGNTKLADFSVETGA